MIITKKDINKYEDMHNHIIHGDCLDIMPLIPNKSIDMICCDLPYGTTSCKWDIVIPLDKLWEQYERIIKDDGAIVLFGTQPFTSILINSNLKLFKYEVIWGKSKCGSPLTAKYRILSKHENILIFGKGRIKYNPQMEKGEPYKRKWTPNKNNNHNFGIKGVSTDNKGTRYPTSILNFPQKWRRQDQVHPTQKPIELYEYLIRTFSNEGDIILDNSAGSGGVGVACNNVNRNYILIEKEYNYCLIADKRVRGT